MPLDHKSEDCEIPWNTIVTSLATKGGQIVTKGNLCYITLYIKKFNHEIKMYEKLFKTVTIKATKLQDLYDDIGTYQWEVKVMEEERNKEKEAERLKATEKVLFNNSDVPTKIQSENTQN